MSTVRTVRIAFAAICLLALSFEAAASVNRYCVRGKVEAPEGESAVTFMTDTSIQLDGGDFKGFPGQDGTFEICDLPRASYILEVVTPNWLYDTLRVDVSPSYENNVQAYIADFVGVEPFPKKVAYDEDDGLTLKPVVKKQYFQVDQPWRITDLLKNPMVFMMLLPLALMYLMPKKEQLAAMQQELREEAGQAGGAAGRAVQGQRSS